MTNMPSTRIHRLIGLAAAVAVIAAACGGDGDDSASGTTTTAATTTTTTAETTTTTAAPTTTTLAGEPFDIVPAAGEVLGVVGVPFDDVLNVRAGPGTDQEIITTLAPTAADVISLGEARLLPNSIWYAVEANGVSGWASSSFLAQLGGTDDITSQVVDELGEIPSADTMLELGLIVAETRASEEPPSRIVVTVEPSVGDLGEVTYDVVGLGDDSVLGERLVVFGQQEAGIEGFSLKGVEATLMCSRGVTSDGICV